MEMQNIQNGIGMLKQLFGPNQSSSGRAEKGQTDATQNFLQVQAAKFHMEVSLYSETEFQDQGNAFTAFSLEEVTIDFSMISGKNATSSPPSTEQAADPYASIFGEDGFWGANKTAARIADFVIAGAGNDVAKLRAGREGILQGLKAAEEMWGSTLPEISYATMEKALEQIDERISQLGASVIDIAA